MDTLLAKDNLLLSSFDDMNRLCAPLKKHFSVDGFTYLKILPDLSRVHLDTNPGWSNFFYTKAEEYFKHYMTGHFHWDSSYSSILALNDASTPDAIAHGVGEGVLLCKRLPDGSTELAYITHDWAKHQNSKLPLLMSHIDVLETFMDYFRESASDLIEKASQNPIIYPFLKPQTDHSISKLPVQASIREPFLRDLKNLQEKRKSNIEPDNIFVTPKGKLHLGSHYNGATLSIREFQLFKQLILGKKPKHIQEELGIRKSTYDNMLHRIQTKMQCTCKNELFYSSVDSGLVDFLIGE